MTTLESEDQIDFCTLGMFIIDEIHFKPPRSPVKDILGGAGSYSAFGARLLSPPPLSKAVGWIVDAGSDFPDELRHVIDQWDTSCLLRETPERLTTRGWNGYGDNEHRSFKYLTEKLRIDHNSLTPKLLLSKSFHLICSPPRCIDLVVNILARRRALDLREPKKEPLFIWEPVPDRCLPEELEACYEALKYVDVVSPNHMELCAFFGVDAQDAQDNINMENIRTCCKKWLDSGVGIDRKGSIVVRMGKEGCLIASRDKSTTLEAFHQDARKVIDPTGGGNAFLGGLGVALVRTGGDIEEAAVWGTCAASLAIEQLGTPKLNSNHGSQEMWNGVVVDDRLASYKKRLGL